MFAIRSSSVVPAEHSYDEQDPLELSGIYVPGSQILHMVAGLLSVSREFLQLYLEHGPELPAGTKVPAEHSMHDVDDLLSSSVIPARQLKFVQAPYEPAGTYVPWPHEMHDVVGVESSSTVPAEQGVQIRSVLEVAAVSNVPAQHGALTG